MDTMKKPPRTQREVPETMEQFARLTASASAVSFDGAGAKSSVGIATPLTQEGAKRRYPESSAFFCARILSMAGRREPLRWAGALSGRWLQLTFGLPPLDCNPSWRVSTTERRPLCCSASV